MRQKYWNAYLSQLKDLTEDQVFTVCRTKRTYGKLTDTWTCRFDDSKLFEQHGFATGSQHHSLLLCNN